MPNAFFCLFSIRFGVYEVEYLGGGAGHAALLSGESLFHTLYHTLYSVEILTRMLGACELNCKTVILRTSKSDLCLNGSKPFIV